MEVTRRLFDAVMEVAEVEGLELHLHDDYSGRFMFGRKCFAVSGLPKEQALQEFLWIVHKLAIREVYAMYNFPDSVAHDAKEFFDTMCPVQVDQDGTNWVYFFPEMTVEPKEEDNNE